MAYILANQIITIALLLAIGIWVGRKMIVSYEAGRMFANVALVVITPVVTLHVLQRDLRVELLEAFGYTILLVALFHILATVVAMLVIRGNDDAAAVDRMLSVGSNCSYMGMPLMASVLSEHALVYAVAYLVVFNVYLWTGGMMTLRRTVHIDLKSLVKNPAWLGIGLGLALFAVKTWFHVELPSFLSTTLESVTQLNTPLPTIVTGILLAHMPLLRLLREWRVYLVCALRLLVMPLLFLGVLLLIRAQTWVANGNEFVQAIMIACACPCPMAGILLPARLGMDTSRGGALVGVSTALSIVTIPLVVVITNLALAI